MLVCICKGVSDRRIQDEIRRGNGTLGAIQHGCQAGTDCGSCVNKIRKMLSTTGSDRHEQSKPGAR